MDWFLHGMTKGSRTAHQPHGQQQPHVPAMVPQLQGDPTFLYGGYGYRPPSFGYAWSGASQATSFAQLPTDTTSTKPLAKPLLSKSASAPDLQNAAAAQQSQKAPQPQPQHHVRMEGTPPVPKHKRHFTVGHGPPGTPGESAANTPSSSRASTPPRRGISDSSFYIGMAAA